jgi:hypothetical protein
MRSVRLLSVVMFSMLGSLAATPPEAGETFTATAVQGYGVDLPSVPVTFVIERYTTEAEHAAVIAALQDGTAALHRLLAASPDIGRIIVRDKITPVKYVYSRSQSRSRVALLTNEPLAYMTPATQNQSKSGFDFAFARLDFSLPGFGGGEVDPAVKVGINANGQIETQDYGAAVIRLTDVRKQ